MTSSSGTQQQLQQPALLLAPAAGDPDDLEKKSSTTQTFVTLKLTLNGWKYESRTEYLSFYLSSAGVILCLRR